VLPNLPKMFRILILSGVYGGYRTLKGYPFIVPFSKTGFKWEQFSNPFCPCKAPRPEFPTPPKGS